MLEGLFSTIGYYKISMLPCLLYPTLSISSKFFYFSRSRDVQATVETGKPQRVWRNS